jgi:hypothetical protein
LGVEAGRKTFEERRRWALVRTELARARRNTAAACVLLGALAVFQTLLVCGVPLGRLPGGGQHEVLPTRLRVGSLVSLVIYVLFGWVLAGAEQDSGRHGTLGVATWVIAGFFLLGAAGNLASRSRPERLVMTPIAVVLCGLTVLVAVPG